MSDSLAIVIPAFKIKYFDEALLSISRQTNKNFTAYVCDDGSKEDIKSVVDKYAGKINIIYHRFPDNLGATALTRHWDRSVRLAKEDWVWLFSDDDVLPPNCVQAFFDALGANCGKHNIYRFNIEMIDVDGKVICIKEPHPETEIAYDFLQRRLQGRSLSAAVEYIFKKEVFERNNGFINFPLAYCSDDASWITFAEDRDIYTMRSEKVYWRASNINISSAKGLHKQKIEALLEYSVWVKSKFNSVSIDDIESWFFENLKYVHGKSGLIEKYDLSKRLAFIFNKSRAYYCKKLLFNA